MISIIPTASISTTPLTYIEKLESHFHPLFLSMSVNTDSKKWNIINYVKMLEQMCRERNIEIKREPFPIPSLSIYIEDQTGKEKRWTIEDETDAVYKIFHYDMVSMVAKNKTFRDTDGKLKYEDSLYVPKGLNRFTLDFVVELFFNNLFESNQEDKEDS
jgi:hypothetical protein